MIVRTENASSLTLPTRKFQVNELLNRAPILLDDESIKKHIFKRKVLITGASGSIGSELAKQIAAYNPSELIVLDRSEATLTALEYNLKKRFGALKINVQLADITDEVRIRQIFELHRPQIVYHAAALKHVPFLEKQPYDAIKTNILGTSILAEISVITRVEKFIYVSTDKAVNPCSLMGATKRFGEMIMATRNDGLDCETQFVTARFGNVLGSSGSVVNLFEEQILAGGPITLTHKDMMRFFMTPFEAGQLLLEAGAVGMDRQVLIYRMGQPIFITDLALKMISLHQLQPYSDIDIEFEGIRPGEKFYEELLSESEEVVPSHHPQIITAFLSSIPWFEVENFIKDLKIAILTPGTANLKAIIRSAIPEYTSSEKGDERLALL